MKGKEQMKKLTTFTLTALLLALPAALHAAEATAAQPIDRETFGQMVRALPGMALLARSCDFF